MSGENNWIEWAGGERPVAPDTKVEIMLRVWEHETIEGSAFEFDWRHVDDDAGQDIVRYRVVPA